MPKFLKEAIEITEYKLELQKAIYKQFPDAKTNTYERYYAKSVNQTYNGFSFTNRDWSLSLNLYYEMPFSHNGKDELIKVDASPYSNDLVWAGWGHISKKYDTMRFVDFNSKFLKNKVRLDVVPDCQLEIVKWMRQHPQYKFDSNLLDKRIKELITFM